MFEGLAQWWADKSAAELIWLGIGLFAQLMFSMRRKGKLLNPLRMTTHEAAPVPARHKRHFKREIKKLLDDLEATPIVGINDRT